MSVTTTRLDGNNIGFYLDGVAAADVLALDLATGKITSPYMNFYEILALNVGVESLFKFIPYADRNAAALQILTRLVGIAPADAGTYTPTAIIVGDLATLNVAGAAGGRFIVHVPQSSDGAIAWASGLGGGAAPSGSPFLQEIYTITRPMILAAAAINPIRPNLGYPAAIKDDPSVRIFANTLTIKNADLKFTSGITYMSLSFYAPPFYAPPGGYAFGSAYMSLYNFTDPMTSLNYGPQNFASGSINGNSLLPLSGQYIIANGSNNSYTDLDFSTMVDNGAVLELAFLYYKV